MAATRVVKYSDSGGGSRRRRAVASSTLYHARSGSQPPFPRTGSASPPLPFLPSPPKSGGGEGRRRRCGRRGGWRLRRWDPVTATGAGSDGDGEDGSNHEKGDSGGDG
uniref:Uncharacterized protein n=1 Tax=Oryza sativa subsp. japonica TaxID=39947 RepID=Q6YZM2_ORYSJ|nr:hypothetical protein [Oryza sativa Japonica Group]